ncbi:ATPase associated with various cellular activities AAA_5 [Desulfovibrio sp. X2]|uniref:ATP-binding protein n=1 Tax=Desulfovibrio sp. X2 TaxID=941449 RepID=UPI000358BF62|nr:ATP-binding protein [Desulfovibrio sp. X2]EPR40874.1 ATPase associated with various cellular activities AAA_5 [Desulfovibrio sp. X2]
MIPRRLKQALSLAVRNRFPVLVVGPPGVGKSEIVAQVAAAEGFDLVLTHPVIADPTDYKGMPFVVEGRAEFLPFGDLRAIIEADRPTVCFMDDLGQAPAAVQAAAMQLLLARRVGGHAVSPEVTFVAATNRRQDRAGVQGILEPVKSRFVSILHLEPDVEDWCAWAAGQRLPHELTAFVRLRPELLTSFEPSRDMANSVSPRTVAHVGALLAAAGAPGNSDGSLPREVLAEMVAGAAGPAFAQEFMAFVRVYGLIPDPRAVLADPGAAAVPGEISALYALCLALAARAAPDNFPAFAAYAGRLPAEFSVLMMREAVLRDARLAEDPAFAAWAADHADVVL